MKGFQLKHLNLKVFPNIEQLLEGPSHMALYRSCLEIVVTFSVNKAVVLQTLRLPTL